MHKRFLSVLQYIIFLGGGILLVWWQLRSMKANEKEDFINALRYTNFWIILPVVAMGILSHISRAMRWKLLMKPLGYRPALKNVFFSLMMGYFGNAAVPRLGEVLKCTFLAKYEKLKVDKLFGTIIVERLIDLISFIIFIGITILLQISVVGGYIQNLLKTAADKPGLPIGYKLLILIIIVAFVFFLIKLLFRKYPNSRIIIKINNFLKGLIEGIKTIKTLKHRKLFLAHTIFIWLMYLLQIYVGFSAMESTATLGINASFTVLTVATLAMIVTPGGIGTFPLFVTESLLIYNIAFPQGNAFGWLIWGINTGIVILLGIIALLILPLINKKKYEIHTINTIKNL